MPALNVPELVRNKARVVGAADWLDELPGLVAELEREWSITLGRSHEGGSEAFVADATLADGTPAVLKVLIPRDADAIDAAGNEMTVLRLANGEGCAQLFRGDPVRNALLLERLGPSLNDVGVPLQQRHEILCTAAQQLWRPAPDCGLPTGAKKGRWLIGEIERLWEELGRPCSERAVAYALDCARRRVATHDDERAVLVHGDIHEWNALRAKGGFKLIDPDGLLAEAEYDLGVLMREDPVELREGDQRARAEWLAARTGLDASAIWEWGAVERVSTGLLCTAIGLQPVGREMLATADQLSE